MAKFKVEVDHVKTGAWAGLIGGVVFGAMMGALGFLPMVGALIGSSSPVAGFLVHIVISVGLGALFAVFFGHASTDEIHAVVLGLLYGFIWWILGALFIMPVWLGMGPMLGAEGVAMSLPSLWGHLVFGFILGLMYSYLQKGCKSCA
ncbi:hypothetical protein HOI83_00125 [Candidatus Uhrbacteria bacterium]|jgi:hypothetical protein|nr:hypothetical protein [Candidatus Uhrbacteria bacterium]